MKKHALIYIGILLLLLTVVTAWRMRPEPAVEANELYLRCKDWPGVRVGFIKDFPLDDTLVCDVTTFEALTDEGWQRMVEELDLQRSVGLIDSIRLIHGVSESDIDYTICLWQCKHFHPEMYGDTLQLGTDSLDCVLASISYRWVSVYHAVSLAQAHAVVHYHMAWQVEHPMTMMPTKDDTIKQQ